MSWCVVQWAPTAFINSLSASSFTLRWICSSRPCSDIKIKVRTPFLSHSVLYRKAASFIVNSRYIPGRWSIRNACVQFLALNLGIWMSLVCVLALASAMAHCFFSTKTDHHQWCHDLTFSILHRCALALLIETLEDPVWLGYSESQSNLSGK